MVILFMYAANLLHIYVYIPNLGHLAHFLTFSRANLHAVMVTHAASPLG